MREQQTTLSSFVVREMILIGADFVPVSAVQYILKCWEYAVYIFLAISKWVSEKNKVSHRLPGLGCSRRRTGAKFLLSRSLSRVFLAGLGPPMLGSKANLHWS